MNDTRNWNSTWLFRFSILSNSAAMARGMIPICDPSLQAVPMVYVFPDPVWWGQNEEKKCIKAKHHDLMDWLGSKCPLYIQTGWNWNDEHLGVLGAQRHSRPHHHRVTNSWRKKNKEAGNWSSIPGPAPDHMLCCWLLPCARPQLGGPSFSAPLAASMAHGMRAKWLREGRTDRGHAWWSTKKIDRRIRTWPYASTVAL